MSIDERLKNLRGSSRRDFLRWSGTVAAVLGLERSRFLNVIGDTAGSAMADIGSCKSTQNSIHLVAGNGGFSWFQLIFPHTDIATGSNPSYAFHSLGNVKSSTTTDNTLIYAPESPFQKLGKKYQISAFMAGAAEMHTSTPITAATASAQSTMLAGITAIQTANPTLLPVIAINPFSLGQAPGVPAPAPINSSADMVNLFDSAASKTLLAKPTDADLHEAYYKAFLGLNAAAGRSTVAAQYAQGKVAANLLGKNLADQLRPTTADDARYGINTGTPTNVVEIAHAICTGIKAFTLGLTSAIVIPAMRDDPHGAFAGGDALPQQMAKYLGGILDAMMLDASAAADPSCSGKTLMDNLMLTIHGDTPKTPLDRSGWSDTTPNNSNWLYVMSNGYLKTGWFGGVRANGTTDGWNPATGATVTNQVSSMTSANAATAALYAAAKGDLRRVQDFSRADITGVVNAADQ